MPVVASMVATDVVELVHAPPGVELERVVVVPTHALAVPVITPGNGSMVIDFVM